MYHELLNSQGYEVIEAASAEQGTHLLISEPIDLILLDIKMPEIEGAEMFQVIEEYHSKIKIIVVSAYNVEQQRQWIGEATDYYDKSESTAVLLKKVRRALANPPFSN